MTWQNNPEKLYIFCIVIFTMNISFTLLGIIIIVFIAQAVMPGFTELFIFNPQSLMPWQFITSIFLHGGIEHILFNSLGLIMFGPYLEKRIGSKYFLVLFLLAGVAGS